jgi:hypothetical protein
MKNALAQHALKYSIGAASLTEFAAKFGEQLPAVACGCMVSYDGIPSVTLYTGNTSDDKDKALSLYGDVFGRDGWMAEESQTYRGTFNWSKTIDGVPVTILHAEQLPPKPTAIPVPPSKFPIQLADAAPVVVDVEEDRI